jgi:hypothetical protein
MNVGIVASKTYKERTEHLLFDLYTMRGSVFIEERFLPQKIRREIKWHTKSLKLRSFCLSFLVLIVFSSTSWYLALIIVRVSVPESISRDYRPETVISVVLSFKERISCVGILTPLELILLKVLDGICFHLFIFRYSRPSSEMKERMEFSLTSFLFCWFSPFFLFLSSCLSSHVISLPSLHHFFHLLQRIRTITRGKARRKVWLQYKVYDTRAWTCSDMNLLVVRSLEYSTPRTGEEWMECTPTERHVIPSSHVSDFYETKNHLQEHRENNNTQNKEVESRMEERTRMNREIQYSVMHR